SSTRLRTVSLLARDDEREDEAEERERFGEGDAEEHGRADHGGGFGLAGHRGDGVAHHDADADAGADGRAAVDDAPTDGREALLQFARILGCEDEVKHGYLLLLSQIAQCSGCMAPPM